MQTTKPHDSATEAASNGPISLLRRLLADSWASLLAQPTCSALDAHIEAHALLDAAAKLPNYRSAVAYIATAVDAARGEAPLPDEPDAQVIADADLRETVVDVLALARAQLADLRAQSASAVAFDPALHCHRADVVRSLDALAAAYDNEVRRYSEVRVGRAWAFAAADARTLTATYRAGGEARGGAAVRLTCEVTGARHDDGDLSTLTVRVPGDVLRVVPVGGTVVVEYGAAGEVSPPRG